MAKKRNYKIAGEIMDKVIEQYHGFDYSTIKKVTGYSNEIIWSWFNYRTACRETKKLSDTNMNYLVVDEMLTPSEIAATYDVPYLDVCRRITGLRRLGFFATDSNIELMLRKYVETGCPSTERICEVLDVKRDRVMRVFKAKLGGRLGDPTLLRLHQEALQKVVHYYLASGLQHPEIVSNGKMYRDQVLYYLRAEGLLGMSMKEIIKKYNSGGFCEPVNSAITRYLSDKISED